MAAKIVNGNSSIIHNEEETSAFLQNGERFTVSQDISINVQDTTCGLWCLKGCCLQKFANKKAYVILYGLLGCIFSASFAYFNGTITTLEKRFKIPSRTTGKIYLYSSIIIIILFFQA